MFSMSPGERDGREPPEPGITQKNLLVVLRRLRLGATERLSWVTESNEKLNLLADLTVA